MRRDALAVALLATCSRAPAKPAARMIPYAELAALAAPPADDTIPYGTAPQQFGELRVPNGRGPFPVVMLIHGGCWRAQYDLKHVAPLADALARDGNAVWTIEYRRVGDAGGGWPGTFDDVAAAMDHLRTLAKRFPLDTARVVTVGHSAGGHLALWLATRRDAHALRPHGVVSLAGIADLATYATGSGSCNTAVPLLMGGTASAQPARYDSANPIARLPLGVAVHLVHGAQDPIVPVAQSKAFAEHARAAGDRVAVHIVEGAGHFDVVAPSGAAWNAVRAAVRAAVR